MIDWLTKQSFPKKGFQTLSLPFDETKIQGCYQRLEGLSQTLKRQYHDKWQEMDHQILHFLKHKLQLNVDFNSNYDPVTFNNINHDGIKYQSLTQNAIKHEMKSFHYVEGTYEEVKEGPKEGLELLKQLSEILSEARSQLTRLLKFIEQTTTLFLSLKLWQHSFEATDHQLLPLHVDRSLFSIILHTEGVPPNTLKIFPNKEGALFDIVAKHKPYPLKQSDFPLLIPGRQAKDFFGIPPTPHYVGTIPKDGSIRNSLILFIGVNQ